jgi:hypothetical protein
MFASGAHSLPTLGFSREGLFEAKSIERRSRAISSMIHFLFVFENFCISCEVGFLDQDPAQTEYRANGLQRFEPLAVSDVV